MTILFALAFLLSISVGNSLKCYQCTSTKSSDLCDSGRKVMTCPVGEATCVKFYFHGKQGNVSTEAYGASCGLKSQHCKSSYCDSFARTGFVNKCQVSCCDDDLCNTINVPPVKTDTVPLKCYQCQTTKSWADCSSNEKVVTCSSGQDTCANLYFDGKVGDMSTEIYRKMCSVKSACKDQCKGMSQGENTINKCEVKCCDSSLCNGVKNGVKVPLVSSFLLFACVLFWL